MTEPTCRCGRVKARPFNTGSKALPICLHCDRVPPDVWPRSDLNRRDWSKPFTDEPQGDTP